MARHSRQQRPKGLGGKIVPASMSSITSCWRCGRKRIEHSTALDIGTVRLYTPSGPRDPSIGNVEGEPLMFRHECEFSLPCVRITSSFEFTLPAGVGDCDDEETALQSGSAHC